MVDSTCTLVKHSPISNKLINIKFSKKLKGTELSRRKSTGTSWMNLLNRCKKYRDKFLQLTITSIIISISHALCIVSPNHNLHWLTALLPTTNTSSEAQSRRHIRLPIWYSTLSNIPSHLLHHYSAPSHDCRMLAAATSLVLHGLLWVSEITSLSTYKYLKSRTLQRRDVSMQPYGTMKVTIRVSNTDQQAWGHQILIGCTGGTSCPALLIQRYLDHSQHHKSRPLFYFQSGHYHTHYIFADGLHEYLLTVGANPKLYSTHSFDIRSTRAASSAGVYPTLIRDFRCWRSNCYQYYIWTPPTCCVRLNGLLYIHVTLCQTHAFGAVYLQGCN